MRKLVILLFIGLFIISCQKDAPDPVIINTIESEFRIIPWQQLNDIKSDFNLIIQSEELQDCSNSELDAEIELNNSTINIQINGISQSQPCQEGMAYAEKTLPLDMDPGIYEFQIRLGSSIQNSGTIEILDDQFKMNLEEKNGIALIQDSLLRIEEGVSWGYIDDKLYPSTVITEINNGIFENIRLVTSFQEGNYGHFEVGDLNVVVIADAPDNVTGMLLDIRPADSWQNLKETLSEATSKYPDLKYRFTRWDGLEIWN